MSAEKNMEIFNNEPPPYPVVAGHDPGFVAHIPPAPIPVYTGASPVLQVQAGVGVGFPVPQTPAVYSIPLGSRPINVICPQCGSNIITSTKKHVGLMAYLASLVLCCAGCFCGCCLIPCCIDECLDTEHTCPNCNALIGKYSR